jgi:hypothetical protein
MAITLGTPTSSGNQTNSSGFSFNHTTAANTKCLVVVVTGYDSSATDSVINSVTWNSVGMTEIAAGRYRSGSGFISIWWKMNPQIGGAYSVTVTAGGTCTDIQATAIGLIESNSALTVVYDKANSGDSSTTSHTVTVSSVTTGAYGVGGIVDAADSAVSGLAVTTGAEISGSEADMGSQVVGCATAAESGGNITITWSKSSGSSYAQVAAFKPLTIASQSISAIPITCSATKILVPTISIQSANQPPSVSLVTPTDDETVQDMTPTMTFTGTDPDGNDIEYEVLVDTSASFDSGIMWIKYVDLKLKKFGSPTDQLIAGWGSGHYPDDGYSDPVNSSSVSSSGGVVRFTFPTPVPITYIGTYHISLHRYPNVHDETNYVSWNYSTSDIYAGGVMYSLSYTGDDHWGYFPTQDLWLKIYNETGSICYIDTSFTGSSYFPLYGGRGTDTYTRTSQDFTSLAKALIDQNSIDYNTTIQGFYHDGSDTHPFTSGHEISYTPLQVDTQICYFNDSTPYDPDSKWATDSYAFDSSTSTSSACAGACAGTKTFGYLQGDGTSITSLTNTEILRVEVYLDGGFTISSNEESAYATVYSSTDEELGTCSTNIYGDDNYALLSPPSGGWTLAAIQGLKVRVYAQISSGVSFLTYRVDLKVWTVKQKTFADGATVYWKVAAKDPTGSNTWGSFTTAQHFHIDAPGYVDVNPITCSGTKILSPRISLAEPVPILTARNTKLLSPSVNSVIRMDSPILTCTHAKLLAPAIIQNSIMQVPPLTAKNTKILTPIVIATFTVSMSCSHAQIIPPTIITAQTIQGLYTYQSGNSIVVGVEI